MPRLRSLKALPVLAALAAAPAPALAGSIPQMSLGESVAAPIGYVEFCRRNAQACPEMPAAPQYDKTYWSLALKAAPRPAPRKRSWRFAPTASIRFTAATAAFSRAWETAAELSPPMGPVAHSGPKLAYSAAVWSDLEAVNQDVNKRIIPTRDRANQRVRDYWDLPLTHGRTRRGDCEDYVLEKREALIRLGYPPAALSIALVRTPWRENHVVLVVESAEGPFVLDSFTSQILPWSSLDYRWMARQSPDDPSTWVEVINPSRRRG